MNSTITNIGKTVATIERRFVVLPNLKGKELEPPAEKEPLDVVSGDCGVVQTERKQFCQCGAQLYWF